MFLAARRHVRTADRRRENVRGVVHRCLSRGAVAGTNGMLVAGHGRRIERQATIFYFPASNGSTHSFAARVCAPAARLIAAYRSRAAQHAHRCDISAQYH